MVPVSLIFSLFNFVKDICSEFKIKLKNINKNRMVIISRVFISEDFLVNPLLSQMQLLQ
jgi:hypothetical protein